MRPWVKVEIVRRIASLFLYKSLQPVFFVVVAMWMVQVADFIIPLNFNEFGLRPRMLQGLIGIGLMPFLHAGFGHLLSNTVPLAILLGLTVTTRHQPWHFVMAIVLGNGILLWLFGRNAIHVGASGLVFGLIAYLITVGIREKQLKSLLIAILVGFFFGTTLLFGVVPTFRSAVSWDGHLCGAISGVLVALVGTGVSPQPSRR